MSLDNIKSSSFYKALFELKDYAFISIGVMMYALGATVFMLPYGLTTGGVAGISSIIYYATGVEIQVTYAIINVGLLIAAVKILGIRFCIKTIYAVILMTTSLWLFQRLIEVPSETDPNTMVLPQLIGSEIFMACVLGAIICGCGLALCFESNGSTGGTDIIAAIVNKYRQVSLGSVIMACDVVIISSCYFVFHDWARVIYGFVMLFICSLTLDYCIRRRHQSVQFMIFSRNPDPIASAFVKAGHGVTVLDGEGWYTRTNRKVVISIVRRREQAQMQFMIKNIDPYAFISLTDASSVWGCGFDPMKVSEKREKRTHTILVYATNNAHKLAEARAIFGEKYEIRSLEDIGCHIDIPEKANTPEGNALLKARFVKRYYGFDCVADDTVLEVDALGGMPGIYSRNYAAVNEEAAERESELKNMVVWNEEQSAEMLKILHSHSTGVNTPQRTDARANVNKVLERLQGKADRSARIRTVLAYITGDFDDYTQWKIDTFEGIVNGHIATEAAEGDTFAYDSIFIPDGCDIPYQQMTLDQKNSISHRAIAIRKMLNAKK